MGNLRLEDIYGRIRGCRSRLNDPHPPKEAVASQYRDDYGSDIEADIKAASPDDRFAVMRALALCGVRL